MLPLLDGLRIGMDQLLRHESGLRARVATVLGRSSNSRSSLGMGFSHGAFPAKPLISSFRPDVSAGSKVYLLCSSRTTISAPSLRPSAFGSRNASALPDLNTFARYSLTIPASVRSEERRVGQGGVSRWRSRWSPYH